MKQNEKAEALESDGSINKLFNELTMKNFTPTDETTQPNFNFGRALKVFEIIHCYQCKQHRELDGFQFKLVPVCSDCRTERELEILSKQIERRQKR